MACDEALSEFFSSHVLFFSIQCYHCYLCIFPLPIKMFFPYLNKYAKSFGFEKFTLFARAICHTNTFPDKNPSSTV